MKISVIIPVYNTGERLRRCLDSVVAQTFEDFECIVVDDGSKDQSPQVIDEFAAKDSRFIAIHKPNGGVSTARNVALDRAEGEWIVFVDSDDILKEHHLAKMHSVVNSEIDFVYTSWEAIMRDTSMRYRRSKDMCYLGKEQLRDFICKSEIMDNMMPWGKMFRRSIIENEGLRFDTCLTISEDRLFCYNYLLSTRGAVTISDISYTHDASDENSLSNRSYPTDVYKYRYNVFIEPTHRLIKHFDISSDDAFLLWQYIWSLFTTVIFSIRSSGSNVWIVSKQQQKYFSRNFCWGLYKSLKDSPAIKTFMERAENRQIVQQHFLLLNIKNSVRSFLNKLHIKR